VVGTQLAHASNFTLDLAIAVYAVAMLSYALDLMFRGQARVAASTAAAGARTGAADDETAPADAALVAAIAAGGTGSAGPGGASPGDLAAFPADPAEPSELADLAGGRTDGGSTGWAGRSRWPAGPWLRGAFALTCAGLVLQLASMTLRGIAEHRLPWGNMFEFIVAISCAAVIALVAASVRFRAYFMGLFVLLPVVVALGVDVVIVYTAAGPLVPALQSYWLGVHVTAMIIAMGMFIFGAVVTVLYLLADRSERKSAVPADGTRAGRGGGGGILALLPGAQALDRLAYRAVLFAFPAWTFGVIAGAIWADHAWGRYWGWDPKETWSFITWVVYAAYLHARATAGWRGRRAAAIQLTGFACVLFNLVGINLWVAGLHSYAGLH
jgi:cytochrome c-type biogenesis protein CcsB